MEAEGGGGSRRGSGSRGRATDSQRLCKVNWISTTFAESFACCKLTHCLPQLQQNSAQLHATCNWHLLKGYTKLSSCNCNLPSSVYCIIICRMRFLLAADIIGLIGRWSLRDAAQFDLGLVLSWCRAGPTVPYTTGRRAGRQFDAV